MCSLPEIPPGPADLPGIPQEQREFPGEREHRQLRECAWGNFSDFCSHARHGPGFGADIASHVTESHPKGPEPKLPQSHPNLFPNSRCILSCVDFQIFPAALSGVFHWNSSLEGKLSLGKFPSQNSPIPEGWKSLLARPAGPLHFVTCPQTRNPGSSSPKTLGIFRGIFAEVGFPSPLEAARREMGRGWFGEKKYH